MATQLQIRRGTSTQVAAFTGAEGEIVVNTTNDSVHVNDGSTAGGFEMARADLNNVSDTDLNAALTGNTVSALTITTLTLGATAITATGTELNLLDGVTATTAELNYVDGVTSAIQTQIDTKAPLASPTFTGTVTADGLTSTSTSGNQLRIAYDSSFYWDIERDASTGSLTFTDVSDERMRIDGDGNVGIGTSSPSKKFVVSEGGAHGFEISPYDGSQNATRLINYNRNTNAYFPLEIEASQISFETGSSERMRITDAGSVGIGSTNPLMNLHLSDTGDTGIQITKEGALASRIKLVSDGLFFGVDTSNGDTERVKITNNGDLKINGSGNLYIRDTGTFIKEDQGLQIGNTSGTGTTRPIRFFTESAERMRIDASGHLMLGVSSISDINTAYKSINVTSNQIMGIPTGSDWYLNLNSYYSSSNDYKFKQNGYAVQMYHTGNGTLAFRRSTASGTAGNVVSFSESMRINSSGNLLVGTTSGSSKITVDNTGVTTTTLMSLTDSGGTGTHTQISFNNTSGQVGTINTAGSATTYNTSSDQRLKENIADADDAGSKVDAIQVRKFDWIADGSHQDYGMVAQELQTVAPEAVSAPEDPDEMMGVDYSKLVPMLVKEIQSLRARVNALEAE